MKKRIITLFFVALLSLILTFSISFASVNDSHDLNTIENESDVIIPTETSTFIDKNGDLVVTKVVKEVDMIRSLQNMSDEELKDSGLSTENIRELRSLNIQPETKSAKASSSYGELTYSIRYHDYSYNKKANKTYISTTMAWSWSKKPKCIFTDIPATAIGSKFIARTSSSTGKVLGDAHVNYYRYGKKSTSYSGYHKIVENRNIVINKAGKGSYLKVSMLKLQKTGKYAGEYYALGGGITTKWVAQGKKTVVGMRANYGHSILSTSVGVTISESGGSISFSPKLTVKHGSDAYISRS